MVSLPSRRVGDIARSAQEAQALLRACPKCAWQDSNLRPLLFPFINPANSGAFQVRLARLERATFGFVVLLQH
jgi:hypothetical protein